jgi:adenosyl cobinamide kinase/adenosyl cobinamide phosphate guanylyltransferase
MPSTTPQLRPPVRASCRFDRTFSAPLRLREAIADVSDDHCLLIDCLTLWTANALEAFGADQAEATRQLLLGWRRPAGRISACDGPAY